MRSSENREERIKAAEKSLKSILRKKKMPASKIRAVAGLISRIAFMQISLEDLEADINENGETEPFSQTPGISYDRERPSMGIYNRTVKNFASAYKQLMDMLPEETQIAAEQTPEETELLDMMKRARR